MCRGHTQVMGNKVLEAGTKKRDGFNVGERTSVLEADTSELTSGSITDMTM